MASIPNGWLICLSCGLAAGGVIVCVDNFAFGGEISPIVIVAMLLASTTTAGFIWGCRGWIAAAATWACVPMAHLVKHVLGIPDTIQPNTYVSILYLAIFSLVVTIFGTLLGCIVRNRRARKWFAATIFIVAIGVGLFLGVLWLEHNSPLELPAPTGEFAVGREVTTWVDNTRLDPFAPSTGEKRELLVWMWYPARPSRQAAVADYIPAFWRDAPDEHASPLLTNFLWKNPTKVKGHSFEDVDLAPDREKYPVVIFRSGIGAMSLDYTTLLEDLASHGYIVVSADAPYSTWSVVMPDGRVIHKTSQGNPGDAPLSETERNRMLESLMNVWASDTRFLLDQIERLNAGDPASPFAGRIDLASVGIVGHSFGGATAAQVCHEDARFRAGIDMDGALHGSVSLGGLNQPILFLLSDHGDDLTSPDREIHEVIRSVRKRSNDDSLIVTLIGADHFSFSDNSLIQSRILRSMLVALGGPGGNVDPRMGLALTAQYVREFFDVHLRGTPRDQLYSSPLTTGARFEAK